MTPSRPCAIRASRKNEPVLFRQDGQPPRRLPCRCDSVTLPESRCLARDCVDRRSHFHGPTSVLTHRNPSPTTRRRLPDHFGSWPLLWPRISHRGLDSDRDTSPHDRRPPDDESPHISHHLARRVAHAADARRRVPDHGRGHVHVSHHAAGIAGHSARQCPDARLEPAGASLRQQRRDRPRRRDRSGNLCRSG